MGINNCTGATRLSQYYAGAGIIPFGTLGFPYGQSTPIPITGPIALSNFYGAVFDPGLIINGNFATSINATEDATKFKFLGWTIYKQAIRLNGNSYVINCLTPNNTTPLSPIPPSTPGDLITFDTGISNNPGFAYRILDTTNPLYSPLAVPNSTEKFVLEISNQATLAGPVDNTNPNLHGILRGPVVVSDFSFKLAIGDTITFNWRAVKSPTGDQYAVFIYLVQPGSCLEIILLDTYGINSGWQTVSRTIVTGDPVGSFKFVAVHGSYDSSGGAKVGAYLYLHDIKIT